MKNEPPGHRCCDYLRKMNQDSQRQRRQGAQHNGTEIEQESARCGHSAQQSDGERERQEPG